MRPLVLRVAGLRSYRHERTLDFNDRSLIAILGDTGSGKSSLLEAIYGALYGASTWDARGLGALVADGVKTLQIELEFSARGKRYTVSRSTSRDNYPPSKHILKGPDGEHVDGERNVNRRVAQIVGLTDQEFLRVVILPQGRFGQLLQGTAGDRAPILRGILGLSVLDRVRDIADRQSSDLADALEPLTSARARLYPDPTAVSTQAEEAVTEYARTHDRLARAAEAIAAIDLSSSAVEQAIPALRTTLADALAVDLSNVIQAVTRADLDAADLDAAGELFRAQRATHEAANLDLTAKLANAATEGLTAESIARAGAALDQLIDALPALHRDVRDHATTHAALTARETSLASDTRAATAAREAADQAKAALTGLEIDTRSAADVVRDARKRLTDLGTLLATFDEGVGLLEPATHKLIAAASVVRDSRLQLAQAHDGVDTAVDKHNALLATNQAAHIAAGHNPGEPCPVCGRDLPADFSPAPIVGEDDLKAVVAFAETKRTDATKVERTAERALDKQRQELLNDVNSLDQIAVQAATLASDAGWLEAARSGKPKAQGKDEDAHTAESLVENAVEELLAVTTVDDAALAEAASTLARRLREHTSLPTELHGFEPGSTNVQDFLEPLVGRQATATQALDQAKVRADTLADQAAALAATLATEANHLESDRTAYKASTDRTTSDAGRLAKLIRALPPMLAEPLITALRLAAPDAQALLAAPALPGKTMDDVRAALSRRADELTTWRHARDGAREGMGDIDRKLAELADERRNRVDVPRGSARVAIERAAGAIRAIRASLPALEAAWQQLRAATPDLPPLPGLDPDISDSLSGEWDDAELTVVVADIAERLVGSVAAANAIREAADEGLERARGNIAVALGAAQVPTLAALTGELSSAAHLLRDAEARLERAQAQTPIAAGLDAGLDALTQQLAVLRAIKDVMSPSLFPNFVVTQRQTALLRIASTLLAKLTRAAYGFGEDFMIIDRRTGQPRHPKTLSGGETFLASLGLALALVEISNRSGGQLDALFLDEGFGSLDASILGDALDVLREQATGGRLVGVISHVHAVAAELDDVLVVSKGVDGSDFRWLDAEERDHYLVDDVSAALLA